jgi:hypothetical protein
MQRISDKHFGKLFSRCSNCLIIDAFNRPWSIIEEESMKLWPLKFIGAGLGFYLPQSWLPFYSLFKGD